MCLLTPASHLCTVPAVPKNYILQTSHFSHAQPTLLVFKPPLPDIHHHSVLDLAAINGLDQAVSKPGKARILILGLAYLVRTSVSSTTFRPRRPKLMSILHLRLHARLLRVAVKEPRHAVSHPLKLVLHPPRRSRHLSPSQQAIHSPGTKHDTGAASPHLPLHDAPVLPMQSLVSPPVVPDPVQRALLVVGAAVGYVVARGAVGAVAVA